MHPCVVTSQQTREIGRAGSITDEETGAPKLRQLAEVTELEKAKLKSKILLF